MEPDPNLIPGAVGDAITSPTSVGLKIGGNRLQFIDYDINIRNFKSGKGLILYTDQLWQNICLNKFSILNIYQCNICVDIQANTGGDQDNVNALQIGYAFLWAVGSNAIGLRALNKSSHFFVTFQIQYLHLQGYDPGFIGIYTTGISPIYGGGNVSGAINGFNKNLISKLYFDCGTPDGIAIQSDDYIEVQQIDYYGANIYDIPWALPMRGQNRVFMPNLIHNPYFINGT